MSSQRAESGEKASAPKVGPGLRRKTGDPAVNPVARLCQVPEEPQGVSEDAKLLEAFAEIPAIGKAFTTPSAIGGVDITVTYTQRDLPGNKLRKFLSTVHIPVSVIMGAAPTM